MIKNKKAIIFGISGQDGSYLANFLIKKNYHVFGVSRKKKIILNLKKLSQKKKIKIFNINQNSEKAVRNLLKKNYDEIYYLSGVAKLKYSYQEPFETIYSSTNILLNILESCRKLKLRSKIYNASSSEIFGNQKDKINENSYFNPISAYALAKLICHYAIISYRDNFNIWCCTGFAFNHDSPLRTQEHIIPRIISDTKKIKINKKKKLYIGDLNISRDWGWAPDYVTYMWKMLQKKNPTDLVIGTGVKTKLSSLIKKIFLKYNLDFKKNVSERNNFLKIGEYIISNQANNFKLKKVLKIKKIKDIDFVVEKMINNEYY